MTYTKALIRRADAYACSSMMFSPECLHSASRALRAIKCQEDLDALEDPTALYFLAQAEQF